MEEIEKISEEVMNSLQDYCIHECQAYCCREGHLIVTDDELNLIADDKKENLISEGAVQRKMFGKNLLNFDNSCGSCPQLKNFKCMIHSDPRRPNTCKIFPIFIVGKEIKISPRCPAKRENKFFKFEKDATRMGYFIVEDFSFHKSF